MQKIEDNTRQTREISLNPNIPEITDTNWWLENGGKKVNGICLFANFVVGGLFSMKKAKELKAFIPDVYGIDYEILLRFILNGKIGYLNGHHYVARCHASNDGTGEEFKVAMEGITRIFQRTYELGLSLGFSPEELLRFKRRNLVVFANMFLVNKWLSENGVSIRSLYGFYKIIKKIDKTIFFPIITSYTTICWLIRKNNEKLYYFIRKIIRFVKNRWVILKGGIVERNTLC